MKEILFQNPFNRFLIISLSVHLGVFGATLLYRVLAPKEKIRFVPSLRVDIVGLPDLKKSEIVKKASKVKEVAKEKPKSEKKQKKSVAPSKKDLLAAINTIKTKAKTKKGSKKPKAEKETQNQGGGMKDVLTSDFENLYKGNKISKGTSTSGEYTDTPSGFTSEIQKHIQANWAIPPWLERAALNAVVTVHLDHSGKLLGFYFVKRSGHAQFDTAVKKALKISEPYPQPPEHLADQVRGDGITLGFPL